MHTPPGFAAAHALPAVVPAGALVFAFRDAKLAVAGGDAAPAIPTWAEATQAGLDGTALMLGTLGGVPCIALGMPDAAADAGGLAFHGLRSLFFRLPDAHLALAARAFQVVEFDRTHRHCGRCGAPTADRASERARECTACGYVAYPRVSPAMMALVTRGRELLLARAHRFPAGMYSALAGFVEPGETIEDCIVREVREEVGLDVGRLAYFGSQSWSFPHSLMIAFTAEYAGGEIRCEDAEIAEARWFAADAMPSLPPSVSIARRLIDETARRLRG